MPGPGRPPESRVYQAGYTVRDLDTAIRRWIAMGAGPFYTVEVDLPILHRGRRTDTAWRVAHGFCRDIFIELIEPGPGPSIYTETLRAGDGPGLHHLMIQGDYAALLDHFGALGYEIAASHSSDMAEFVYLDAVADTGHFIELYNMGPAVTQAFQGIADAHAGWDGTDPVRRLTW